MKTIQGMQQDICEIFDDLRDKKVKLDKKKISKMDFAIDLQTAKTLSGLASAFMKGEQIALNVKQFAFNTRRGILIPNEPTPARLPAIAGPPVRRLTSVSRRRRRAA